jgi:lipoprotein-anchoring transpeptidase ErfK/SrfK
MKHVLPAFAALAGLVLFSSCASTAPRSSGAYKVTALKPRDPSAVRVKVSTSTQNVYVTEGDRVLMAVQGCVGKNGTTPMGNHRITNKIRNKRSGSYGFTSNGGPADREHGNVAVGYPMGFWCEFRPGYGFHEGFVHPTPKTHGCIRLHKEAAARLWALVNVGTPVSIATSQPEDATVGRTVRRLDQSRDPDPSPGTLMSNSYFTDPAGPLLTEG